MKRLSEGHRTAATTALIYLAVSALWILLSDRLLAAFADDVHSLAEFQTYKGWFFVSVTALLLYFSLKVHLEKRKSLESQLLRAQRMENLGRLAGGIAHDLNNILGPVLLGSEVLSHASKDENSRKMLEAIRRSAERGRELVRQILSIARGSSEGHPEIPLHHIVQEVAELLSHTFPAGIRVRTEIPADLWPLRVDPGQLHQMLMNLGVNAGDAMPGGGSLVITARNVTVERNSRIGDLEPGIYVELDVSDSGTGISPDNLKMIFEPYFTTKEVGKGTGLGLAITRSIVENHNGHIAVESKVGGGTTFRIYLPASKVTAMPAQATRDAVLPPGRGEEIMIVDDEELVRNMMKEALEARGYRVVLARNGADALAIIRKQGGAIKVITTDLVMPVMDGPGLLRNLEAAAIGIPVIVTSGTHEQSEISKSLKGLKYFAALQKPYSVDSLVRAIQGALSSGR